MYLLLLYKLSKTFSLWLFLYYYTFYLPYLLLLYHCQWKSSLRATLNGPKREHLPKSKNGHFFFIVPFLQPGKNFVTSMHLQSVSSIPFCFSFALLSHPSTSFTILFYIRHLLLPQLFHTALLVFKHNNPSLSTSVFFITIKLSPFSRSLHFSSSFFLLHFLLSLHFLLCFFSFSLLQHLPSSPPRESHLLQNFPFSYWKSVVLYVYVPFSDVLSEFQYCNIFYIIVILCWKRFSDWKGGGF